MKRTRPNTLARSSVLSCWLAASFLAGATDPLAQGKRALAEGQYLEAVRLLEQARGGPSACAASFYLGLAHQHLKQMDRAIVDLQSASECDAGNAEPRIALGVAYAEKGDDNRAQAAFESALRIKPDDIEVLRAAAALDLRHERNDQAISKLEKLIAFERKDAKAFADLGSAYAAIGSYEKAREQFDQALKIRPNDASALVGLGSLDLKTGHTEDALALLTQAATIDPKAYEPRYLRAAAYNALGRFREAVAEGNEALRLGGTDAEIYYHLARAYRSLGREEDGRKALAEFSRLRSQTKDMDEARREASRLLEQAKPLVDAGNLIAAISLLEGACRLDDGNPQLLFRLAGLYFDMQQLESARDYVSKAVVLAPSEWRYHYLLGLIEKSSGKPDSARASLETTIRLNPSAADAFNQLGDLAMRRRDFADAIRNFEKAVQLDSRDTAFQLNLRAAQQRAASQ
ncbi:MAG: hypothetical protein DMG57_42875 [Acidobacteria bacterium]|nr:MAG: hypothetical protein DMG57_42875 [Acidobacteriota bacterium]